MGIELCNAWNCALFLWSQLSACFSAWTNSQTLVSNLLLFQSVRRSWLSLVTSSRQVTLGWRPLPAQCFGVLNRALAVPRVRSTYSTGHFSHCYLFRTKPRGWSCGNSTKHWLVQRMGKEFNWAGENPDLGKSTQNPSSNTGCRNVRAIKQRLNYFFSLHHTWRTSGL